MGTAEFHEQAAATELERYNAGGLTVAQADCYTQAAAAHAALAQSIRFGEIAAALIKLRTVPEADGPAIPPDGPVDCPACGNHTFVRDGFYAVHNASSHPVTHPTNPTLDSWQSTPCGRGGSKAEA